MKTLDNIASEALRLPVEQQLSLVHQILVNVNASPDPEVDAAWDKEIQRRIRQYDNGEVVGIPGPEVFRTIREKLKK